MQLTDLGFLFLLLPVAAAAYYCVPNRRKPLALLTVSAFFLLLIDRRTLLLLLLTLLPDCALLHRDVLRAERPRLLDLCIAQHAAVILIFGLLLPQFGLPSMTGLSVLSLSAVGMLVDIRRGGAAPSPADYAAAVLFFGRIPLGPAGYGERVLRSLQAPRPSLSGIGRGVMLLISGVAKQVAISGEFIALFRTLSHLDPNQIALATSWLYALCCVLGLYFVLSGFSDIAQGLGLIFSIDLPRTVYYPLQALGLREYVYRLNMPLEDFLRRMFLPGARREQSCAGASLVSMVSTLLLGLLIDPTGGFLPWSLALCALLLLDGLVFCRIPVLLPPLGRVITFLLTLPAYLLLLPVGLGQRLEMFGAMFGIGGPELFNSTTLYLLRSNIVLMLIGLLFSSSLFDRLGRLTERRFPRLWWLASSAGHLALLVVATSFLLWNVR